MDYLDDNIITITAQESAERIDALLARCVPELTRSAAARLIEDGAVTVGGRTVRKNYKCAPGDEISLIMPEAADCELRPQDIPIDVVYEDDDMLIINKPAPLPTGASARQDGITLESVLFARYGLNGGWQFRPVNRLDKGTSGLLAAARTAHAHFGLQRQLHTPAFEREYLALTVGAPAEKSGVIDLPIGREPDSIVKRRIDPEGRPCRTHYAVLGELGGIALVRLRLETGRTHQIRVHMAALGCPVFGDFLYGQEDERLPGRFALHSWRLSCVQPVTGEQLEFIAPLPARMAALSPKVDNFVPNLKS